MTPIDKRRGFKICPAAPERPTVRRDNLEHRIRDVRQLFGSLPRWLFHWLEKVEKWPAGDHLPVVEHQQAKVFATGSKNLDRTRAAGEIDIRDRAQIDVARKKIHAAAFVLTCRWQAFYLLRRSISLSSSGPVPVGDRKSTA